MTAGTYPFVNFGLTVGAYLLVNCTKAYENRKLKKSYALRQPPEQKGVGKQEKEAILRPSGSHRSRKVRENKKSRKDLRQRITMFGKKKKTITFQVPYDPSSQQPVIRASICTGEKVAGFRDCSTGKIKEVLCIQNDEDLAGFMDFYRLTRDEIKTVY